MPIVSMTRTQAPFPKSSAYVLSTEVDALQGDWWFDDHHNCLFRNWAEANAYAHAHGLEHLYAVPCRLDIDLEAGCGFIPPGS